jgi:hypothetical protein
MSSNSNSEDICIPTNIFISTFSFLKYIFKLDEEKRDIATTMTFTNVTLPFASTPICAMLAPTVHVHVQASDKIHDVAPYALSSLTSFVSSSWSAQWEWHWTYILYAFLTWQTFYTLHLFWWKAPVQFPPLNFPYPPN